MQLTGMLVWWLWITIIGLAITPLTLKVFKHLPDRGYGLTKPLGLLLLGLLSWLFGFLHFSTTTIIVCFSVMAGAGFWFWKRYEAELRIHIRSAISYIIMVELFFLALFLLFLAFRMYNPDIIGTEKFMDLAFMNALTKARSFPPYDPWLSGPNFTISYYYFGYLLMAIMCKLSGVAPAIGFNLALGLLFALAGTATVSLLYNLTRSLAAGFGGWAGIYLLGNLDGLRQVLTTKTMENFNWWTPSRVIPDTINEFPFFSFLLGDMHPHMLSIPYVMLGISLALNHLKSEDRDLDVKNIERAGGYVLWGLVIGAFGFLNSWDLPTQFFLALSAFFFQQYRQGQSLAAWPWKDMLLGLGLILACAVIPYVPFYVSFHSQAKGIGITTQNTKVADYLIIYGIYLLPMLTFVLARYHQWFVLLLTHEKSAPPAKKAQNYCAHCGAQIRGSRRFCGQCGRPVEAGADVPNGDSPLSRPMAMVPQELKAFWRFLLQPSVSLRSGEGRKAALWALAGLGLAALAAFFKSPFLALTVLAMAALVPLLLSRADKPETVMALLLLFTACLLSFGADVLHINDTFQAPLDRMNTVFKFYYQVWFLLGIGAVYGIYWSLKYSLRHPNLRVAWMAPMVLLIMGSLVYPYASILVKTNHFANVATLDGSFYLANSYPADRAGIEWMRAHIQGTPVVLEATGGEYTDFARVSTFTGLPTVLGWAGHELQWRGNYDEPAKRIPDIDTLYTSLDLGQVKTLLDRYQIDYVFVGTLERRKYPEPGLQKFAGLMEKVFEHPDGVTIYRRR